MLYLSPSVPLNLTAGLMPQALPGGAPIHLPPPPPAGLLTARCPDWLPPAPGRYVVEHHDRDQTWETWYHNLVEARRDTGRLFQIVGQQRMPVDPPPDPSGKTLPIVPSPSADTPTLSLADPRFDQLDTVARQTVRSAMAALFEQTLNYVNGDLKGHAFDHEAWKFTHTIMTLRPRATSQPPQADPTAARRNPKGQKLGALLLAWGDLDVQPFGPRYEAGGIRYSLTEYPRGRECLYIERLSPAGRSFTVPGRYATNRAEFQYVVAEIQGRPLCTGPTFDDVIVPRQTLIERDDPPAKARPSGRQNPFGKPVDDSADAVQQRIDRFNQALQGKFFGKVAADGV